MKKFFYWKRQAKTHETKKIDEVSNRVYSMNQIMAISWDQVWAARKLVLFPSVDYFVQHYWMTIHYWIGISNTVSITFSYRLVAQQDDDPLLRFLQILLDLVHHYRLRLEFWIFHLLLSDFDGRSMSKRDFMVYMSDSKPFLSKRLYSLMYSPNWTNQNLPSHLNLTNLLIAVGSTRSSVNSLG